MAVRALFIVAAVGLLLLAGFGIVAAQPSAPTPAPQVVDIPGGATLEPGGSVTFRRPADGATLAVTSSLPERVTLYYGGTVLTVTPFSGECWIVPPSPGERYVSCGHGSAPRAVESTIAGVHIRLTPVTSPPACPGAGSAPVIGPGLIGPCPAPSYSPIPFPSPFQPSGSPAPTRPPRSPAPSPQAAPLFRAPEWSPRGPNVSAVAHDQTPIPLMLPPFGSASVRATPLPTPAPGAPVSPRGPRPPAMLAVRSYSDAPAELMATAQSVTIRVAPDLVIWAQGPQGPCRLVDDQPNQVSCFGGPVMANFVAFTTAPASGERVAVLDLSDPRPCIPETGQERCSTDRRQLWDGLSEAWAARGVTDPDAVFGEAVLLRVRAVDPATISAIARVLGAPYLKVTRVRFVGGVEVAEVTNLGGGPQDLTGWTIRSPARNLAFRLPAGVTLQPGQSCYLFTGRPGSNPGGECRAFTAINQIEPPLVRPINLNEPLPDVWPDDGGEVVLFYDALGLPGDDTLYSADPAAQPVPPFLRLIQFVPPEQR